MLTHLAPGGVALAIGGVALAPAASYPADPLAVFRFRFGRPDYTDSQGSLWKRYTGPGGDNTYDYYANSFIPGGVVGNTADPELYYAALLAQAITLPVPAGTYQVQAGYCESFRTSPGLRSSSLVDGPHNTLIAAFDVYTAAGGQNLAVVMDATATVVAGSNGLVLDTGFLTNSSVTNWLMLVKIA